MNFSDFKTINWKKSAPIIVAISAALIIMIYYIASGRGSLDKNIQSLEKTDKVQTISQPSSNSMKITCKNGQSYNIIFKPGQTNFEDVIYNKCGEEGGGVM